MEREYLDQVRRSVLQMLAAWARYNPASRYTLDVRIVERRNDVKQTT